MTYVYIAKNDKGKIYIGVSYNAASRLVRHNTKQGSVFTKSGNFQIVFKEEYQTLTQARRREIQIKKWRREKKEQLIERYQKGLPTKNNTYASTFQKTKTQTPDSSLSHQ